MKYFIPLIFISMIFVNACSSSFEIIDKPVSFTEARIDMTKEYMIKHYRMELDDIEMTPKVIVLHWTAIDNFDSCWVLFNRETLGNSRPDLEGSGNVNVGVQFLVDRNGQVHRLTPETWMGRHCIGINYNSIGVENAAGQGNVDNLTEAQLKSNIELVKYLKEKYPSIVYLIGHHEYREFEGHPLWKEVDENYRTTKYDPGDRFMNAVRKGVNNLGLKGVDEIRAEKKPN